MRFVAGTAALSAAALGLRLALLQIVLQAVLLLLARGLGRRLRWEIVAAGLVLPWVVLAPWLAGGVLLAPTSIVAGQIPGIESPDAIDPHGGDRTMPCFISAVELEVRTL